MLMRTILQCASILAAACSQGSAYTWPDTEDLLETIYYQQVGFKGRRFGAFVRTCDNGGNLGGGRTNTAEWIRTAYHDMATADVEAGTGGVDASIGFERNRPENVGRAFFDTLLFFENFESTRSSAADIIALGAVMSVTSCTISEVRKPVILDFKGGRLDATEPGPTGVPEPHQDLATHVARFKKHGFNNTEMIAVIACGHSLGGINGRDFPDTVPVLNDTSLNLDSKQNFDGTQAVLDNNIAVEFLNNKSQNPLAFGHDETTRSDFRVFNSDGGDTMRRLASSQDFFLESCAALFQRMIDTVPRVVKLSEPITPIPLKPDNINIAIDTGGTMTITGNIRIRTDNNPPAADRKVVVHLKPRTPDAAVVSVTTATKLESNTTGFFPHSPSFDWWAFNATAPSLQGYSSFTVEVIDNSVPAVYTNGGLGFPVETDLLPQTGLSCGTVYAGKAYLLNVTVAVRDEALFQEVKLNVPIPVEQSGSMVPRFETYVRPMQKTRTLEGTGFSFYTASFDIRSNKFFTTIMSYGLSGHGGSKDVEVPFLLWSELGLLCKFPAD